MLAEDIGLSSEIESNLMCIYNQSSIHSLSKNMIVNHRKLDLVIWCIADDIEIDQYEEFISRCISFLPVMVICNEGTSSLFGNLVKIGIRGIIKVSSIHELSIGIKKLIEGNTFLCQKILRQVIGEVKLREADRLLSDRELQILNLLSRGSTYLEISNNLYISFDTTKSHVYNIYKKLNARNKSEAVYKARKNRILM